MSCTAGVHPQNGWEATPSGHTDLLRILHLLPGALGIPCRLSPRLQRACEIPPRGGFAHRRPTQHTAGLLLRRAVPPAAPDRFPQPGNDLGRETDPPRAVRGGLDPIQASKLAPFNNG